jgi:hypothetical protein
MSTLPLPLQSNAVRPLDTVPASSTCAMVAVKIPVHVIMKIDMIVKYHHEKEFVQKKLIRLAP